MSLILEDIEVSTFNQSNIGKMIFDAIESKRQKLIEVGAGGFMALNCDVVIVVGHLARAFNVPTKASPDVMQLIYESACTRVLCKVPRLPPDTPVMDGTQYFLNKLNSKHTRRDHADIN